jgi:hypothetical protein
MLQKSLSLFLFSVLFECIIMFLKFKAQLGALHRREILVCIQFSGKRKAANLQIKRST